MCSAKAISISVRIGSSGRMRPSVHPDENGRSLAAREKALEVVRVTTVTNRIPLLETHSCFNGGGSVDRIESSRRIRKIAPAKKLASGRLGSVQCGSDHHQ